MFELTGTHFVRGIFELRLAKTLPQPLKWMVGMGAIRGRLFALAFILGASFLTVTHQPYNWLVMQQGWTLGQGMKAQSIATTVLMVLGLIFYVGVFFLRQEKMVIEFDRHESEVRYHHVPLGAKSPIRDGAVPFAGVGSVRVVGPEKEPRTPHGYIELNLTSGPKAYRQIRFRILSDEQFKIYPTNIGRIMGKPPVGDWTDPDDELASGAGPRGGGTTPANGPN